MKNFEAGLEKQEEVLFRKNMKTFFTAGLLEKIQESFYKEKFWCWSCKLRCKHVHDFWDFFDSSANFLFIISETKCDY